ncbi:asparagine synthetase B family protein [Aestuariicoccus sp. MJ-SS9]|uniref:asparagine synthetase B family protein n=1 Tax=Aestuariicoccus sp. MJ-SS9 TaxID=3079855 RepID=UPI00291466F2|nr:asparagine synthase-related protein [Aestuariicoccus sp. MJ-SS9]MDU8913527.1 asparagine synthase-related protein [Aestuariicoccus sp. MJ-SS9]
MNLVFGILRFDGTPVSDSVLTSMAEGFVSAPDLERRVEVHLEGPIGMGRLTIGGRSVDHPLTREGALICAADARLYQAPGIKSPKDLSAPDREALLCALHAQYGDDAPAHIDGDFAYVIWDENLQRLSFIRDRVGVRPLFYFHEPGQFLLWSSHSDMIVRSGLITEEFNLDAALAQFTYDMSDVESTLVKGMKRLPPAHKMHVTSSGEVKKQRYWELKCENPIRNSASLEGCASKLRQLLTDAVSRRLPQNETIGAHLSGGLDSSSVSILAARALQREGRPLHTYSFVSRARPDVHFIDERPYTDAAVQSEPNIYNTKISPPEDFADSIAEIRDRMAVFWGAEEKVLGAAERDKIDVILSGWGGDEIASFNGKGAYAEHFVRGRWRLLWEEVNARSARLGASKRQVLANEVAADILPHGLWKVLRRAAGKKEVPTPVDETLNAMVQPEFRQALKDGPRLGANTRKNRLLRFTQGHIAYRLENWAMQGAYRGIQYTFPMLDRQLLEYAIRLPASFTKRNGLGRAVFREAMQGVVPESVRTLPRKLAPFPCNLLRLAEQKNDYLEELQVMREDPRLSAVLDCEAVETLLQQAPDVDQVKAALNEEAAGGPSPSLEPTLAVEPLMFLRILQARLGGRTQP